MTASIHAGFRSTTPIVARATRSSALILRHVLLEGCTIAAWSVLTLTDSGASGIDADLALLLHGMAAIKALMVVAAIALLVWRFGRPVERRVAVGYLIGVFLITGATAMIWQLAHIVPAAAIFHFGALLLLVVAWRDEGTPLRLHRRRAP